MDFLNDTVLGVADGFLIGEIKSDFKVLTGSGDRRYFALLGEGRTNGLVIKANDDIVIGIR